MNDITKKGLIPNIYKQLTQLSIKNNTDLKMGKRTLHFSKEEMQMARRHMKRCSALLIIMATQIKTIMRNYFIPAKMAIIKKNKKNKYGEKGVLVLCWWQYKWVQPLWKRVWRFLKKTKATATT